MQLHLTAAGTPAEISAALTRDVARERTANPELGGTLLGLRDDIAKQTGAGATPTGKEAPKHFTVSAKIEITVDEQANASDAENARKALVGGAPFTPSASADTDVYEGKAALSGSGGGLVTGDAAAIRRRASDAAREAGPK